MRDCRTNIWQTASMVLVVVLCAVNSVEADPQSSSSPQPCVALLEPEYVTHDRDDTGDRLIAWLDMKLTESLSSQKNCTMVSRQAMDDLLGEKSLRKFNPDTAGAQLKPFLAAGVLVCPTIVVEDKATGRAVLTIQAVLAQTGALLSEMIVDLEPVEEGWKTSPKLKEGLTEFWTDMRRNLKVHLDTPTFEVTGMHLKSDLERLRWVADDLRDSLATQPYPGLVLLTPRQPIHTKEERLLKLMGLTTAADGDGTAKLAAATDFQIAGEVIEEVKTGTSFRDTPITLKLKITGAGEERALRNWDGMVRNYSKLRERALEWAGETLEKIGGKPEAELDESHAKALARQALETARRLASRTSGYAGTERRRKVRLAMSALRAWHLDPNCEEAAYLAVTSIGGMYRVRGQRHTLACYRRIIQLGQQYIERFGDTDLQHYRKVLRVVGTQGLRAKGKLRDKDVRGEHIPSEPNTRKYFYLRALCRAYMERGVQGQYKVGKIVGTPGSSLHVASNTLRTDMIPNTPDDMVDEEYKFWRKFWKERVEPLEDGKCIPWDCVEMAFAARRKNPEGVRGAARRLAAKYPKSRKVIWWDNVLKDYLRVAGDPEWKTWQPDYQKQPRSKRPNRGTMKRFYRHFDTGFLPTWDHKDCPQVEGQKITFPRSIRDLGKQTYYSHVHYPRVEFLTVAGGDAWFVAPCLWDSANRDPHTLLIVPLSRMKRGGSTVELRKSDVTVLPWPEKEVDIQPTIKSCLRMKTPRGPIVWLNTEKCGLARFDKTEDGWSGRWYRPSDGMPSDITNLAPCHAGSGTQLFIAGFGPEIEGEVEGERKRIRNRMVMTLDVRTDKITILDVRPEKHVILRWPDGLSVPVDVYDGRLYQDHDLKKARIAEGEYVGRTIAFTRENDTVRLWKISGGIHELDPETLAPRPTPLGKGSKEDWRHRNYKDLLWRGIDQDQPTGNPIPDLGISSIGYVFGYGRDLWMLTFSPERYDYDTNNEDGDAIMVYRPAPRDDPHWAENDGWIGPVKSPDSRSNFRHHDGAMFGLRPDGEGDMWITCEDAVYRISTEEIVRRARKAGRTISTAGWRKEYQKRLADAGWRYQARYFLAEDEHAKALAVIQKELNALPENREPETRIEWVDLLLYRGMALAFSSQYDDALEALNRVRRAERVPAAYKAGRMRAKILAAQGRWKKALEAIRYQEGKLHFRDHSDWKGIVALARHELERDRTSAREPATDEKENALFDTESKTLTIDVGDDVKMQLVRIPAGEFMMGSQSTAEKLARRYDGEARNFLDEYPRHRVRITEPFYMGATEVTQEQYEAVMGENPSEFKGPRNPAENVTWYEAQEFCARLSERTGLKVDLPTEAQWEYASRAGSSSAYCCGDTTEQLHRYANYSDASASFDWSDQAHDDGFPEVAPAGSLRPNAWGLHDMHGNVWEMCRDWYGRDYYDHSPPPDPMRSIPGLFLMRVCRGGSWRNSFPYVRAASRGKISPINGWKLTGFRVVILLPSSEQLSENVP